jgi:hypothetical protein
MSSVDTSRIPIGSRLLIDGEPLEVICGKSVHGTPTIYPVVWKGNGWSPRDPFSQTRPSIKVNFMSQTLTYQAPRGPHWETKQHRLAFVYQTLEARPDGSCTTALDCELPISTPLPQEGSSNNLRFRSLSVLALSIFAVTIWARQSF